MSYHTKEIAIREYGSGQYEILVRYKTPNAFGLWQWSTWIRVDVCNKPTVTVRIK